MHGIESASSLDDRVGERLSQPPDVEEWTPSPFLQSASSYNLVKAARPGGGVAAEGSALKGGVLKGSSSGRYDERSGGSNTKGSVRFDEGSVEQSASTRASAANPTPSAAAPRRRLSSMAWWSFGGARSSEEGFLQAEGSVAEGSMASAGRASVRRRSTLNVAGEAVQSIASQALRAVVRV